MKLARALGLQFGLFLPSGLRLLKDGDSAIHRCLTIVLSTTCTVRALMRYWRHLFCPGFSLILSRVQIFCTGQSAARFLFVIVPSDSSAPSRVSDLPTLPVNSLTAFPILSNRRVSLHARDRCMYFSNNRTTKTGSFKECFYIIRKIQFRLVLFVVVIGQYDNTNDSKH